LIIGLGGACRVDELTNLQLENVKKEGQLFHIFIPNTKTKVSREFFVTVGGIEGVNMVEVIRKYLALRPNHAVHGRFFVGYRGGNCIKLPVGINTFSAMPKKIANFLNLPQAQEYTGHCFRRSSTSLLANTGADLLTIKRHGGWRSNAVCEGYIDTSVENKKKIASKILGGEMTDNEATTSASNISYQDFSLLGRELVIAQAKAGISQQNLNVRSKNSDQVTSSAINFTNCKKCVFNIYQK
jgi:integrase